MRVKSTVKGCSGVLRDQRAGHYPFLAMACLLGVSQASVSSAQANMPTGNQQIQYSASSNGTTVVPYTSIVSYDLSQTLTGSAQGPSYGYTAGTDATYMPIAAAQATTSSSTFSTATARGALDYFVGVSGPDPFLAVPVYFTATLSAQANGSVAPNDIGISTAVAAFTLQQYDPRLNFLGQVYNAGIVAQHTSGNGLNQFYDYVHDYVWITSGDYLAAILSGEVQAQYGASAFASADPYFYIDPSFLLDHPGYSLSFSPGVGNAPTEVGGVPEPSTWAMMLIGFGAIGFWLRRKRPGAHEVGPSNVRPAGA